MTPKAQTTKEKNGLICLKIKAVVIKGQNEESENTSQLFHIFSQKIFTNQVSNKDLMFY